ncbi:MAG: alpha/beta fold hydrolase, partial [Acidobacteriota bacterium]
MSRRFPGLVVIAAAILFSGLGRAEAKTPADRLQIEDCQFDGVRAQVECGTLEVFENRKAAAGRKIKIYFVRARATGPDPAPDPIFELSGGPGAQATSNLAGQLRNSSESLEKRDVVIFDQRGTGRSDPLDCSHVDLKADPSAFQRLFDQDFFDPEVYRSCLQKLKPKADLTQYTTSIIADDINELRQALGYQKINLEGGSYGTRLGLEYIRRHPETVRAAVLRGVAPSSAFLVETVAKDF